MQKKYFLVNSLSSGGAEKVVCNLATEFHNRGFKVEIICLEREKFYRIPENVDIHFLSNRLCNENVFSKTLMLLILAFKLKKHIKQESINLIQSHMFRANYVNVISKILGSKHEVQIVNHGLFSRYISTGIIGNINYYLIYFLYPKADLIINISHGLSDEMKRIFNFENNEIVIHNPQYIEKIKEKAEESVKDFKFNKNVKYIISVSRFDSVKRQEWIIESLSYLDPNFEAIFVGDGPRKDELIKFTENLKLINRVHFVGRKENPFKYMKRSNYFVLSSLSESLSNVIIEALCCGIPVIATDCPTGPREILAPDTSTKDRIINGIELAKYGILVSLHNPEMIALAVKKLNGDIKLNESYIKKGFERAKNFDISFIFKKYINIIGR